MRDAGEKFVMNMSHWCKNVHWLSSDYPESGMHRGLFHLLLFWSKECTWFHDTIFCLLSNFSFWGNEGNFNFVLMSPNVPEISSPPSIMYDSEFLILHNRWALIYSCVIHSIWNTNYDSFLRVLLWKNDQEKVQIYDSWCNILSKLMVIL